MSIGTAWPSGYRGGLAEGLACRTCNLFRKKNRFNFVNKPGLLLSYILAKLRLTQRINTKSYFYLWIVCGETRHKTNIHCSNVKKVKVHTLTHAWKNYASQHSFSSKKLFTSLHNPAKHSLTILAKKKTIRNLPQTKCKWYYLLNNKLLCW